MVSIVQSFWSTSGFLLFSFKTAAPVRVIIKQFPFKYLKLHYKLKVEKIANISYLVSDCVSNSACAVIGVLECPAVGSSAFSSPFVELTT